MAPDNNKDDDVNKDRGPGGKEATGNDGGPAIHGKDDEFDFLKTAKPLNERLSALPVEARAIGAFNFKRCAEVKTLPPGYSLIKIQIPSGMYQLYREMIEATFEKKYGAYLLNPHFGTGEKNSELTVAVTNWQKFLKDLQKLKEENNDESVNFFHAVPASVMRVRGNGVMDFGSNFTEVNEEAYMSADEDLTEEKIELSEASILKAEEEPKKKWPRTGECMYMAVDISVFNNEAIRRLTSKLANISASDKFSVMYKDGFFGQI